MTVPQVYLQPHEGVVGEDRPGDSVLTLVPAGKRLLIGCVYQLYWATAFGNPPPITVEMRERLTHPQPGDYVIVRDAAGSSDEDTLRKGAGLFLGDRREWWTTDEQWEAERAEDETLTEADRMVDHAWYVQYGPAAVDVCRWVNCDLFAVPTDPLRGWAS